jgi:ankyrin repeat protein
LLVSTFELENQKIKKMHVAVHQAVCDGDLEYLMQAIDSTNINIPTAFGDTPLRISIVYKRIKCAMFLINAGADVNICDCNDSSPLMAAIEVCPECVKSLVNAGAKLDHVDRYKTTIFSHICSDLAKNYKLAKFLIDRGCRPVQVDYRHRGRIPDYINKFIESRVFTKRRAIVMISLNKWTGVYGNGRDVLRLIGKHIWSMRML